MGLYLTCRPLAGKNEPIQCPHPASIRKMIAEGQLRETITFLGWFINTRSFTISLPTEKWKAWSTKIEQILESRTQSLAELSSLIGQLNHVCYIIPDARHFMNNLCHMEIIARKSKKVKLTRRTIDDMILWLDFLKSAKTDISINRVIFRKPTIITSRKTK